MTSTSSPAVDRTTRVPRSWLAALTAAITIGVLLQQPGSIVSETKLDVAVDPSGFLARTWSLWDPVADFGRVQDQAVGYLFPMGPFYVVAQWLHVPTWLAERLWIALLLTAATWGAARLLDALRIGTRAPRLLGAAAYGLSPLLLARGGSTSGGVMGAVVLPWLLVPLVHGARRGSPRRAAATSGVVVLAAGGINAVVTAAPLIAPIIWLATRSPGRRRRALAGWWSLAAVLATAWWAVPLLYQQRFGFDFLPFTERADVTTAFTSLTETVRGTSDWVSYLKLFAPWVDSAWILVSNPLAVLATTAIAAVGLAGLARRDLPERRFLVLTFLAGMVLVTAGRGGLVASPASSAVRALLVGPFAPFRNVSKLQCLVTLPLIAGGTHALAVAARWLRARRPTWRVPAAAGATAVVLVGAFPLFAGRLVASGGFDAIPSYWREAAQALTSTDRSTPGRVLVVPGNSVADYDWGRPVDELLPILTDHPSAVRSLIPLGGASSTTVLDAIEGAIGEGGAPGLVPYLRRAGITTVLARNDLAGNRWGTSRPINVNDALIASGLQPERSFGPAIGARTSAVDPRSVAEAKLHELELYRVPGAPGLVQTAPLDAAVAVAGDAGSVLDLETLGVLGGRPAVLGADLPAHIAMPWVVTDGDRRRFVDHGLVRRNDSYVLGADESAAGGRVLVPQPPDPARQTVAEWEGVAGVTASSYGSWLVQVPEAAPGLALDGDPATAWVAGATSTAVGDWWQLHFTAPRSLSSVSVRLLVDGPWREVATKVRVTTQAGSTEQTLAAVNAAQPLDVPAGPTSWLRLTIDGVASPSRPAAPAGLREVTVDGIDPAHPLRLSDAPARSPAPPGADAVYVFSRREVDPFSFLEAPEETNLQRRFTLDGSLTAALGGTARPVRGPALTALLDPKAPMSVQASSTLGDLPSYRPGNLLDGDPSTIWAARSARPAELDSPFLPGQDVTRTGDPVQLDPQPQLVDTAPEVRLAWSGARTLDRLQLGLVAGYSRPTTVVVESPAGQRQAAVSADGSVRFEPLTTDQLTVRFTGIEAVTAPNLLTGRPWLAPLGLDELWSPALDGLRPDRLDPSTPFEVSCLDGPVVMVDGFPQRFSVSTSLGAVQQLRPAIATRCDLPSPTFTLAAGEHALDTRVGRAPFAFDQLVMGDPSAVPAAADPPRSLVVRHFGDEQRTIDIGPGSSALLVVSENANDGWTATLGGKRLQSVQVDGWRQAWIVPAGAGGAVQLRFGPTTVYRWLLVTGGALVLALLALALVPGRSVAPAIGARRFGPALAVVVLVGAAVLAGGVIGGGLALGALLTRRWVGRWLPAVAAVAFVVAGSIAAWGAPGFPAESSGTFGVAAQLAALLAVVAVAAALRDDSVVPLEPPWPPP